MNVTLSGAGGFIGSHLLPALRQRGWPVQLAARGGLPDLNGCEVMIHLAGLAHAGARQADSGQLTRVNAEETLALYNAAVAAGVGKFIWLSSIKVLGESAAQPLAVDAPRQPADAYARSKAEAECRLSRAPGGGTQLAVVRPPLVYGAGVKANFLRLMKYALSGLPLPLAGARQPRAWLGVNNLVDLLVTLAAPACTDAAGVWHVRDAEETSTSAMIRQISRAGGQPDRQWPVNAHAACVLAGWLGAGATANRLFAPLRLDMQQTSARLGWQPPFSQAREIAETVAWFQTR